MMHQTPRRGFSLIEMTIFISILSVLLLFLISWIGEAMRFSARTRSHQRQHQQLTRLAENFRSDVRMSESMSVDDDQRLVLSQANGQRVVYQIFAEGIEVRKEKNGVDRQEQFLLAENTQIQWDVTGMPDRIGLIATRDPHASREVKDSSTVPMPTANDNSDVASALPVDIHIFAQVGRWPVAYVVDVGGEEE